MSLHGILTVQFADHAYAANHNPFANNISDTSVLSATVTANRWQILDMETCCGLLCMAHGQKKKKHNCLESSYDDARVG